MGRVTRGGNVNEYRTMHFYDTYVEGAKLFETYARIAAESKTAPMPAGVVVHSERANYCYLPELSILTKAQQAVKK